MQDQLLRFYTIESYGYRGLPYYDVDKTDDYIFYKIQQEEIPWEDVITLVNIGLNNDFYTYINPVYQPFCLIALVNKYNQLPCDYEPSDLEVIAPEFSEDGLVLRHEARLPFENMCQAALEEGIYLKAISTYRSYSYQETVYFKNFTPDNSVEEYQKNRDKVSARAGHSEHQTGFAVDINDLEETFEMTPESRWLKENAHRFGFILRYPKGKEHITGYSYEPWHYRYLGAPIAEAVNFSNLTYDEFYIRFLASRKH